MGGNAGDMGAAFVIRSPPEAVKLVDSAKRAAIRATGIDEHGRGTAPWAGRLLCVADLLPGERAEVVVEHESRHRPLAWGRVERRLGAPSADRVPPPCPAFGRCGGCAWQHLAYPAQLEHKRARVERALAAALDRPPEVRAPVPAPGVLGYRNKGKYVFGTDAAGELLLGAYEPRSHRVVGTLGCQVVEPAIDDAARALQQALAGSGLEVYDEGRRTGQLRYAIVRRGGDGRLLVALVVTSTTPDAPLVACARALVESGAASGVVRVDNDSTGGRLLGDEARPLAGSPTVGETVAGVPVELDALSFWQIHREQARALYDAVADQLAAGPGVSAVDLYCGAGGIAFTLARRGADVLGIERVPAAVDTATRAAAAAGLGDRLRFVVGDASDLGDAELVVVDPPRKGLGDATRRALVAASPARIAYVSCGPEALGRDLAALAAAGYRCGPVQPFDLMPGTPQIESLVLLSR